MFFRIPCNITVPICYYFTATVGDLFGDADDISSDEEARAKKSDAEDDEGGGGGSDRERQVNYHWWLILYIISCFTVVRIHFVGFLVLVP